MNQCCHRQQQETKHLPSRFLPRSSAPVRTPRRTLPPAPSRCSTCPPRTARAPPTRPGNSGPPGTNTDQLQHGTLHSPYPRTHRGLCSLGERSTSQRPQPCLPKKRTCSPTIRGAIRTPQSTPATKCHLRNTILRYQPRWHLAQRRLRGAAWADLPRCKLPRFERVRARSWRRRRSRRSRTARTRWSRCSSGCHLCCPNPRRKPSPRASSPCTCSRRTSLCTLETFSSPRRCQPRRTRVPPRDGTTSPTPRLPVPSIPSTRPGSTGRPVMWNRGALRNNENPKPKLFL